MPSTTAEPVNLELERAELQALLSSQLFLRSPTLARLLSYLCEKKFAGEVRQVKEYSIALEVFGRSDSFDQDSDSIVRVQVNRLRKRLAEYYQNEGAANHLRIRIPIGQYVPAFDKIETSSSRNLQDQPSISPERPKQEKISLPKWHIAAGLIVSMMIFLGLVAIYSLRTRQHPVQPVAAPSPSAPSPTVPEAAIGLPVGDELRILAGTNRSYVDRAGKLWSPDRYFFGGKPVRSSMQHIWRTQDPSIYRSSRQGDFRYDIPLKPGLYELRLHFAETFYGPEEIGGGGEGSRVLMVHANGTPLLSDFDVVLDAGGSRTADVKVFTGVSPSSDGQLHLSFSSVRGGSATLSAIEVLPGMPGRQRPIRIVTREIPYYSNDSRWWGPDDYFKGGQLAASDEPAIDVDDTEMYETERWGHFSYAIPVAPGRYTVTLYFIERRFDAANRDRYGDSAPEAWGGPGGRLFSVYCNGKPIAANLDLIKTAGENRPVMRRITGLEPNAQGKLLLEFVPTRAYATVSAIEIVAQAN